MPIRVEEVISYLEDFRVKKVKRKLGDNLLGIFKGAIPEGVTSTELIKEFRKPRYD